MSKTCCGKCGFGKNTFVVDELGYLQIRVCLECAKEEGFEIDKSKLSECLNCNQLFQSRGGWQKVCPVCFFKSIKKIRRFKKEW